MINYIEDYKKYNKLLYKFLGYNKDEVDSKSFTPHHNVMGYEMLRWVMRKINYNPKEGMKMRIITSVKDDETEVFIQEWFDISKPDGFINIVNHKETCQFEKDEVSKEIYEDEILNVSHRAMYNACVDYIIKTT